MIVWFAVMITYWAGLWLLYRRVKPRLPLILSKALPWSMVIFGLSGWGLFFSVFFAILALFILILFFAVDRIKRAVSGTGFASFEGLSILRFAGAWLLTAVFLGFHYAIFIFMITR